MGQLEEPQETVAFTEKRIFCGCLKLLVVCRSLASVYDVRKMLSLKAFGNILTSLLRAEVDLKFLCVGVSHSLKLTINFTLWHSKKKM